MDSRTKILLGFLVFLIAAKFVLEPLINWQNDEVARLSIEEKRLEKMSFAATNLPELEQSYEQLLNASHEQENGFFSLGEEQSFTLQRQQELEKSLQEMGLSSQSFGWSQPIDIEGSEISTYRAEIKLNGTLSDFIKWHVELEKSTPLIQIDSINLRMDRRRGNPDKMGNISADLVVSLRALKAGRG